MRILLQRVTEAKVEIAEQVVGEIQAGLLIFIGFGKADESLFDQGMLAAPIEKACDKLVHLRVFSNEDGKLDYSVLNQKGGILLVPQFTLFGKSEKGRRPDFTDAMQPASAEQAFRQFHNCLELKLEKTVETGVFGADMAVSLVNDGPFTLQLNF